MTTPRLHGHVLAPFVALVPALVVGLVLTVALVLVVVPVPGCADASDRTLDCVGGLVALGATPAEVTDRCGEPTRRLRPGRSPVPGSASDAARARRSRRPSAAEDRARPAGREPRGAQLWVFDEGPDTLSRILRFERGRLAEIRRGDYGR